MTTTYSSLDSETKSMVEASLDRFVDEFYEPTNRRMRLNQPSVDYRAHWSTLAELGVLGLPVSEALGGIGGSTQDTADALRVLARGLVLEPLIECSAIASAVLSVSTTAISDLGGLISGETMHILIGGRRGDDLFCAMQKDGFKISGKARVVPGAAQADIWLLACGDESGTTRILRVKPAEIDARINSFRMMDGRSASDIEFDAVLVPHACLFLEGLDAENAVSKAAAQAVSAYCADAVGVMQALVMITGEYLRTREQFGVLLSTFQALQHRYADMHIAMLEARAISRAMARSVDDAQLDQTQWLRYAAPKVISRCGERVGHEAIQLHGGMGVTDELIVSHYNSRLVVLNKLLERWSTVPAAVTQAMSISGGIHA